MHHLRCDPLVECALASTAGGRGWGACLTPQYNTGQPAFLCLCPSFMSWSSYSLALTVHPLVKAGEHAPDPALTLSSWLTVSQYSTVLWLSVLTRERGIGHYLLGSSW